MMDNETQIIALVTILVSGSVIYAVKRAYDENQAYIKAGYHQTASVGQTWVKE